MDFLNPTDSLLLGGDLIEVPKSVVWKDIIIEGSKWFQVNENQIYNGFKFLFENYDTAKDNALRLMKKNRGIFTLKKMTDKLDDIVTPYIDKIPSQVSLNLPKLKKKTKPVDIKLPKLKKLESIKESV